MVILVEDGGDNGVDNDVDKVASESSCEVVDGGKGLKYYAIGGILVIDGCIIELLF